MISVLYVIKNIVTLYPMGVLCLHDIEVRMKFGGLPAMRDIIFFRNEG